MRHFAVSAIGKDMPGIVAGISKALLDHEGNLEDSQMTILRGHFTMMLIVSTPDRVDAEELQAQLESTGEQLGLEAVSLDEVTEIATEEEPEATHIVSVYGADHPGIVKAVSTKLAEHEISITDLTTRLAGEDSDQPLYAMMLEVALPAEVGLDDLRAALTDVASGQSVDVTIRPLEQDTL